MFAIGISVAVSVCSIVVLILWTRDDTRASPLPKVTADGRAAAAGSTASSGVSPASAPTPATSAPAAAVPALGSSALPTATQPATPTPAPPPPTATAAPATERAAPAANTGTVNVPTKGGHRIWIDERLVGESPGSFSIRCGTHAVRIGSAGALQRVNVPCGGAVDVR